MTPTDQPVSLVHLPDASYPPAPPYHPSRCYAELPSNAPLGSANEAYDAVRRALAQLEADSSRFDLAEWNPLGTLIHPGDRVFIKPNMIAHRHKLCDDWEYVITHGSVIRAIIDYVYLALGGNGSIVIGDAPQTDSDFDRIVERMGLPSIQEFYEQTYGFRIDVLDLRHERWSEKDGVYVDRIDLPGDPRGSVAFDLGEHSMFTELDHAGRRYYGAYYDVDETNRHHGKGKHEYAISRSPIECDVFISIPKLKTHKKCGLTVNLKGQVGINADKNWLPHYAFGAPREGGDQFPESGTAHRLENALVTRMKQRLLRGNPLAQFAARKTKQLGYRLFGDTEQVVRSGNWHGNDTVWRMCIDLNRALMYGLADGTLRAGTEPKRFLSVVDGLVAMEGNGPVAGTSRNAGVLAAGVNPVAVDCVCARLMGFDWKKLPLLSRCFDPHALPLITDSYDQIQVRSERDEWNGPLHEWSPEAGFTFKPHFGWIGAIELEERAD